MEDEPILVCTEAEIINILEKVLNSVLSTDLSKEYILTALTKLAAKLPTEIVRIKELIRMYTQNAILDVQQRSCEFLEILSHDQVLQNLNIKSQFNQKYSYIHNC